MTTPDPYPGFRDTGETVELLDEAGAVVAVGVLLYDDWDNDGEGDEWPVWLVRLPDGSVQSVFDWSGFRWPMAEEDQPTGGDVGVTA